MRQYTVTEYAKYINNYYQLYHTVNMQFNTKADMRT